MITLLEVHHVLTEGTAEEVAQLQGQLAQVDAQLQRVSQPLTVKKSRLAQLLAVKQKQLSNQPAAQPKPEQPETSKMSPEVGRKY